MVCDDKAGQGKEEQVSPELVSAEPRADYSPSNPFTIEFRYAWLVALIWTIVLLVFVAAKTSVASTVAATLVSAVAVITSIVGVFQPPKFPTIDPKVTRVVVAAILVVDFGASVGWSGWSYYEANRSVDVLSTVTLGYNTDVLPGGRHATLDVDVTAQRDAIVMVFQVVDHSGDMGICAPFTSLSVTPDTPGNQGGTVTASSGVPTSLDLHAGTTKLHLDIAVTNTRHDHNCGVDLSVVSAKLQNR